MPDQENTLSHQLWKNKIAHVAQLGGIETSTLNNGPGRGNRIAWINTGTGLRYKVVIDRAMDIADAFYNQHSLAWLSHTGTTTPQPAYNTGTEWLRGFFGGLLTTCGLTHTGAPESDEYGDRGLHGLISNIPAELESIVQPEPHLGKMEMSITGRIRQMKVFGECLEMKRTISGTLGQPYIQIRDEVTNLGNTPAPHMLLYHFNFGWPLVDEGADLVLPEKYIHIVEERDKMIYNETKQYLKASAPLEEHRGRGEVAAAFDIPADDSGNCVCGIRNSRIGVSVMISFKKSQLPWLTNWQHWGPGEYVTGLEPGTHPPTGQAKARRENSLIFLRPGESRTYEVTLQADTI